MAERMRWRGFISISKATEIYSKDIVLKRSIVIRKPKNGFIQTRLMGCSYQNEISKSKQ